MGAGRRGWTPAHTRAATPQVSSDAVTSDGLPPPAIRYTTLVPPTPLARSLALAGSDKDNYNLTNTSASDDAEITAKNMTAENTADNKENDGNTYAAYSCEVNGKVSCDAVTCDGVHPAVFGT